MPEGTPRARLQWLGQAGFAITVAGRIIVIDPYLSDSLATKYCGTLFEHRRLFPPPVAADDLACDLVICTHRHTDHMDAATLLPLLAANPNARVLAPAAERDHALGLGIEPHRLVTMRAGERLEPLPEVRVLPLAAAHEDLSTNDVGDHRFLGVVVSTARVSLYHSGDCIPYPGLVDTLRDESVDVALLPVNGRDGFRARHGVPGNFFIDEALQLCADAGIPTLVGHHFGLFDFNTVDPHLLDRAAAFAGLPVVWRRTDPGGWFDI